MTEIDDALQVLRTSSQRWQSIRATGTEWQDLSDDEDAVGEEEPPGPVYTHTVEWLDANRRITRSSVTSVRRLQRISANCPEESTGRWSYCRQGDNQRAEFQVGNETVQVVYRGDTYWSWQPSSGRSSNLGRPNDCHGLGPGRDLLDTAALPDVIDARSLAEDTFVGRSVYQLAAAPNRAASRFDSPLKLLGLYGEELTFTIDAERGVLLRAEVRRRGKPLRVIEMTEVHFDEDVELPTKTWRIPGRWKMSSMRRPSR